MPSVGTPAGVNYTTLANISGTAQSGATAVTATTTLNHGLVIGQLITISGSSVSGHNGDFEVADQNGSTQFIYLAGSSATATGGAATVLSRDNEFMPGLVAGENIQFTKKGTRLQVTATAQAGSITIQEEGSSLSTAATTLNFVGSAIAATGTGATKTITVSASAGNTLDSAYDQGGAGSGRTIAANNGAVAITVADGSNNNALDITQADDNNNKDGILVTMEGTGAGLRVKGATNDTPKVVLENDNASQSLTMSITDAGVTEIAATGTIVLTSDAGQAILLVPDTSGTASHVEIANNSKGLTIGDAPPGGFSGNSLNLGDNTRAEVTGVAIGASNTVVSGPSLAIGELCTVADGKGIALGQAATTAGYESAPSICMSDGTAAGGTFTSNTLVLDSGGQFGSGSPGSGSGPIGGGGSAGATAIAGSAGKGNIYLESGTIFSGSADYAELFEWDDDNSNSVDRRGFFVSLVNGNKIEIGNTNIVGIVSARPVILGDAAMLGWHGRYILDDFGALEQELKDGVMVPKVNPNFNVQTVYTPRIQRKEWSPVGLLGKLFVRSAQTLTAGSKCTSNSSGYAVSGNDYHILRVMRQPTNSKYGIVEILMK